MSTNRDGGALPAHGPGDKQKPIDLLPESVRLRCQAGVRMSRYITAMAVALAVVLVASTLSHVEADRAQDRLVRARDTAELVLQTETRIAQIQANLMEAERQIELHDRIASPLRLSALLATVVNRLPSSVSLDRIDLTTSRGPRSQRGRSGGSGAFRGSTARGDSEASGAPGGARRLLVGEISGFAASDEDIAVLITTLRDTPPLESISLDFSRTRVVRSQSAREFRLSFQIDLDAAFEELERDEATQTHGEGAVGASVIAGGGVHG